MELMSIKHQVLGVNTKQILAAVKGMQACRMDVHLVKHNQADGFVGL
jgi:hypothetical protein